VGHMGRTAPREGPPQKVPALFYEGKSDITLDPAEEKPSISHVESTQLRAPLRNGLSSLVIHYQEGHRIAKNVPHDSAILALSV